MAKAKNDFSVNLLKYPTSEETKKIFEPFPELKKIHISYNSKRNIQFNSTDIFIDYNDFEQWLIRLLNKLGDIRFSYIQLADSFNKGIPDWNWKRDKDRGGIVFFPEFSKEEHNANKFLFDFFIETFYYHYFSSVDILYKVINKLFSMNIDEHKKNFNLKVLIKLKKEDLKLHEAIDQFLKLNKQNRKFRNDFTHNYAVNEVDMRSKKSIKDGRKTVTMMDPTYTPSKELFDEARNLIQVYLPVLRVFENSITKVQEKYSASIDDNL
jgi:Cthe_2314-like HEPN